MYLKNAKLWVDAYYESGRHKWVGAFLGCIYHGCPMCYDKQTFNIMLNKTMGDLYRETERWIKRVKTCVVTCTPSCGNVSGIRFAKQT